MSSRTRSRDFLAMLVDRLNAEEHIVVTLGSEDALVHELEAVGARSLERLGLGADASAHVPETTNDFDLETLNATMDELVAALAEGLVNSNHVEEVFTEDHLLRRAALYVLRETMCQIAIELPDEPGSGK